MRRATIAATLALATAACGTTPAAAPIAIDNPHPDHRRTQAADPTSGLANLLAATTRPTRVRATRGTTRPRPDTPLRNSTPGGDNFWRRLAQCESSGQLNPPGYYIGTFQFSPDTAAKLGIHRSDSYATQQAAAERWSHMVDPSSTSGWPLCWRKAS